MITLILEEKIVQICANIPKLHLNKKINADHQELTTRKARATPFPVLDSNSNVFDWFPCYQILIDWVQIVQLIWGQTFTVSIFFASPK